MNALEIACREIAAHSGCEVHCVGIARQVHGRCAGRAAHSLVCAIAVGTLSVARAIEPRPMHFAHGCALGVPRTHSQSHALCMGLCILRGPAHFAWASTLCVDPCTFLAHALCGPYIDILVHAICDPFNLRIKQNTTNTVESQYHFRPE